MEQFFRVLVITAGIGSGLIAGAFFVFSAAVMPALGRISPIEGMRAMQSINAVIVNPLFLGVFLGTGIASASIIVLGLLNASGAGSFYLVVGGAVYLLGSILVTIFFNVPMNDALAVSQPGIPEGDAIWQNYLQYWTYWNHLRTLSSLLSSLLLILGLAARKV